MKALSTFLTALFTLSLAAHQMPMSTVLLDVRQGRVSGTLCLPVSELKLAYAGGISAYAPEWHHPDVLLAGYVFRHFRITSASGKSWALRLVRARLERSGQEQSGPFSQLAIEMAMVPPPGEDARKFVLYDDLIMHQVITHKAMVWIRQDWSRGVTDGNQTQIGTIGTDTRTMKQRVREWRDLRTVRHGQHR